MHPLSVNWKASNFASQYLTYFTKQRSSAIYLHDTTCISVPILLFTGPNISISMPISMWMLIINILYSHLYLIVSTYISGREKGKCVISNHNFSAYITCKPQTAEMIQVCRYTYVFRKRKF